MSNEHGTQRTVHTYRIQFVRKVTMAHRLAVYTPRISTNTKQIQQGTAGIVKSDLLQK